MMVVIRTSEDATDSSNSDEVRKAMGDIKEECGGHRRTERSRSTGRMRLCK